MPLPRMRPSFILETRCRPDDAMDALRSRLEGNPQRVEGRFSRRHAVLCMPADSRRFWSPCLDLTIEGDPAEQSAEVWGTYGPRPEIWTGFVFAIGTLAILSTLSLFFGVAQLLLHHTPWALAIPLAGLLLGASLYFSALFGQNLSLGDMYQMRAYVDASLAAAPQREGEDGSRPSDSGPPTERSPDC